MNLFFARRHALYLSKTEAAAHGVLKIADRAFKLAIVIECVRVMNLLLHHLHEVSLTDIGGAVLWHDGALINVVFHPAARLKTIISL